jgi:hypothetical protein
MTYLNSFEDHLLCKSSEEVLELLRKYFNGDKVGFPEKINWDGFAFSASMKAQGSYAESYEFLAASSKLKDSFENSSMMLRSSIIAHLGHIDNDPILDSRIIMEWFIERLEFSYEEICEKAAFWKDFFNRDPESKNSNEEINFDEVRNLRHLKERLSIIRTLAEGKNVILGDELKKLLEFRENLP